MALQPLLRFLLLRPPPQSPPPRPNPPPPSSLPASTRRSAAAAALLLLAVASPPRPARAADPDAEDVDEPHVVSVLEEASPSVVFIKDLVVLARPRGRVFGGVQSEEDEEEGGATVEGTGSGFVWDSSGHIVKNYHVVANLLRTDLDLIAARCSWRIQMALVTQKRGGQ